MGGPHLVDAHRLAKTVITGRPQCAVWRSERDCNVLCTSFDPREQDLKNLKVRGKLICLMRIHIGSADDCLIRQNTIVALTREFLATSLRVGGLHGP
jgi:hypothetical protein